MFWASAVLSTILTCALASATRNYPDGKINVHIFSHTHDDPGWLKTIDQYYYGSNTTITDAGVQYILDTVLMALQRDGERKFTYVEMSYFQVGMVQHGMSLHEKSYIYAFNLALIAMVY